VIIVGGIPVDIEDPCPHCGRSDDVKQELTEEKIREIIRDELYRANVKQWHSNLRKRGTDSE